MSVGSMTVTTERAEVLNFTAPYYYTPAGLAVQVGSDIATLDDLAGKTVGVCGSCTYEFYLRRDLNIDIPGFTFEYLVPEDIEIVDLRHRLDGDPGPRDREPDRRRDERGADPAGGDRQGPPDQDLGDPVFSEPLAAALDKAARWIRRQPDEEIAGIIQEMHDDGTLTELSMKWYDEDLTQNPTG